MTVVAEILQEIARRAMDAWGLPEERVLQDPQPNELPEDGDYAAIRCELTNGRFEAGAYDAMLLHVDVAAELADPGGKRLEARMAYLSAIRDRLTPTFPSLTVYPAIAGWRTPVVTEALTTPIEDAPGRLLVALSVEGEIDLPRGGYTGA